MKVVWPDSFVEDANLTVNISLLRKALGEMDDGRPYIQTVPRKGYRFNTPVRLVEPELPGDTPPAPAVLGPRELKPAKLQGVEHATEDDAEVDRAGSAAERSTDAVARRPGGPEIIPFPEPEEVPEPEPARRIPLASTAARRRRRNWVVVMPLCLGIAAVAAGWFLWRRPKPAALEFQQRRLTSFVPEMATTAAAISTGAKFIAYANPSGLFIQVISSGDTHALRLPAPNFEVASISWFPDSAELLVGGWIPGNPSPSLWVIPVIGAGPPVELGPYPPGVVSPDGSEVAWVNSLGETPEIQVMPSGGGAVRTLLAGSSGEIFGNVSWTHTGRRLLFVRYRWDPELRRNWGSVDSCEVRSGKATTVLSSYDLGGDAIALPDGRVLYSKILGANPSAYGGELFAVRADPHTGVATTAPALVARWNSPVTGLSVDASGTFLILRSWVVQHSAYVGDLANGGTRLVNVHRFSLGVGSEDFPRAWEPDGKALFLDSNRSGHWEIFKQPLDGRMDEPFVQGADDQFGPHVAPDGAQLLYIDRVENWREPRPASVMRVPISGGTPQLVLKASHFSEWGRRFECPRVAGMPCVLAERQGNQIVFRTFDPESGFEQGSKELATTGYLPQFYFDWCLAPDGLDIAWVLWDSTSNRIHLLHLNPNAGSLTGNERDIDIQGGSYLHAIAWSPDGKGWFIVRELPASWVLLHADMQGNASQLLTVSSTFAPDVLPSPDGRHLAFSEENFSSNVWLLRNF